MRAALFPIVLLAVLVGAAVPAAADPTAEARAVMDETVAGVLAALGDETLSVDQKRAAIEAIALARFDFETMAKLVLKRDWKKFSEAEQAQFVDAFRTYLAASYGTRITRYNQESVDMTGEKLESRGDVTVSTAIAGGEASGAVIAYRLRNRGGEWRIIDVIIEGISLVSNFRSQFSDVLAKGGPNELLRRLEEKNAENALASSETEASTEEPEAPAAGGGA